MKREKNSQAVDCRMRCSPHPGPLPLGEGERHSVFVASHALRCHPTLADILPLLRGEGRGEGNRFKLTPHGLKFLQVISVLLFGLLTMRAENLPLQPVADPKPLLADLQKKMSSLTSVFLEFDQERRLQLFAEPLKSQGVMMIDRPDLIRWETTAPYQSILLGGRKSVAQFEQTDGQWKKLKLGFPQMLQRVMEQMTLMHQGKLDALTSDFTISVATGHVAVVTLVPKDKDVLSMLAALEIHLLPDLSATREVVMREPGGDQTRIIFRRELRDVKFPPGTFDQTKPLAVSAVQSAVNEKK